MSRLSPTQFCQEERFPPPGTKLIRFYTLPMQLQWRQRCWKRWRSPEWCGDVWTVVTRPSSGHPCLSTASLSILLSPLDTYVSIVRNSAEQEMPSDPMSTGSTVWNTLFKPDFQPWLRWRCGRKWPPIEVSFGGAQTVITLSKTRGECLNTLRVNMLAVRVTHVNIVRSTARPKTPWEVMCRGTTLLQKATKLYVFIPGDFESLIQSKMTKVDGSWSCTDCGHLTATKSHLYEHVESKHVSSGYYCQYCQKFCPSRNALRSHVWRNHPLTK